MNDRRAPGPEGPGEGEEGRSGVIDLDRLMRDLKARVAARRAAGADDGDLLDAPFDAPPGEGGLSVRLRPETAYSSKPVVGRAITFGKRLQIRVLYHFLDDLAAQANAALGGLRAALEAETRAREELEERVRELERERGPGPPGR